MDNIEVKKKDRTLLVGLAIVIVIMVCLCIAGIFLVNPPEETVQGQVEATNVRISGKLPGRIVAFYVEEGQHVKKGDTLAYIHSSTVDAKLYQAQAIEQAASAQNRKAEAGTRSQIISGAYDLWQQAVAAESIHKKTYERVENLFKQGWCRSRNATRPVLHTMLPWLRPVRQSRNMSLPWKVRKPKTRLPPGLSNRLREAR